MQVVHLIRNRKHFDTSFSTSTSVSSVMILHLISKTQALHGMFLIRNKLTILKKYNNSMAYVEMLMRMRQGQKVRI